MIASLGVALVSFVFNERVLTRANRTLDAWQAAEYGPIPRGSDVLVNVWVRDGDDLIHADAVAGCWGFYLIGREIGWLRPLLGLRVAKARTSATPDRKSVGEGKRVSVRVDVGCRVRIKKNN